ncbi:MAG: nucleotidyltransferase domain-containing protein [Geminicoccaceae bacterium]|nr:nucleotidyltransferase domain-containing protein [Geminicoccaceae bacterium]
MSGLQLSAEERDAVCGILAAHLAPGRAVYVFGSRATGEARRFSDLDLAVDTDLSLLLCGHLELAFEESDRPWRVDIVEYDALSADARGAAVVLGWSEAAARGLARGLE